MQWFGASWGAPVNEFSEQTEVPVGASCQGCSSPVNEGDQGYLIPYMPLVGPPTLEAWHRWCFLMDSARVRLPDEEGGG